MTTITEEPKTGEATDEPREGMEVRADGSEHEVKGELFDRSEYLKPELRIDQVDGQDVDKIWIRFQGKVALDRTNAADVALFNKARLGQELELRVAGKGASVGTKHTTSRGGDLDAVVGERTIDVHTVYVLEPEEL